MKAKREPGHHLLGKESDEHSHFVVTKISIFSSSLVTSHHSLTQAQGIRSPFLRKRKTIKTQKNTLFVFLKTPKRGATNSFNHHSLPHQNNNNHLKNTKKKKKNKLTSLAAGKMVPPENTNWLFDYALMDDIPVPDGSFAVSASAFTWPSPHPSSNVGYSSHRSPIDV